MNNFFGFVAYILIVFQSQWVLRYHIDLVFFLLHRQDGCSTLLKSEVEHNVKGDDEGLMCRLFVMVIARKPDYFAHKQRKGCSGQKKASKIWENFWLTPKSPQEGGF
jgi:hypothetical protein